MKTISTALLITLPGVGLGQSVTMNEPDLGDLLSLLGVASWSIEVPVGSATTARGELRIYTRTPHGLRMRSGVTLHHTLDEESRDRKSLPVHVLLQLNSGSSTIRLDNMGPVTSANFFESPPSANWHVMLAPLVENGPAGLENEYLLVVSPSVENVSPTADELEALDWFITLWLRTDSEP